MNIDNIIDKFNNNQKKSFEEIEYVFSSYLNGKISDDDMTIILRAICKYGMTDEEIYFLTDLFINSGDRLNFSFDYVDKHSTGGVGDKTTLIVAPIIASCGVKIAKMSGRALGYTGGTIDKLESIGVKVNLDEKVFLKEVNDINMAISSQTANLCPMDKKVYALRDVTNTVKSIPLIAVSIMSKKIASGAKKILIDVKVGKGALIDNIKDARKLSHLMIKIGEKYDRKVVCMLTRMDNPLGNNIGNSIEIMEVIDVLQNKCSNNLSLLCLNMASKLVEMYYDICYEESHYMVVKALQSGDAYKKFVEFVKYQGGSLNINVSDGYEVVSCKNGYLNSIDSYIIGVSSMNLGAGRVKKDDKIDYNAGIILNKNVGDYVRKGDVLCTCYGNKKIDNDYLRKAFNISLFKKNDKPIIIEIIE